MSRSPGLATNAHPIGDRTVTDAAELGTVLGIWAHPDDEAFLSAGLMAAARDAGNRVVCVTATLGEHGTDDPRRWPPQRLAAVREHELRASLAALGVTEQGQLGIVDGTCAAQPHDAVVRHLARIISLVEPDTMVTFGPNGMTGHEDHQTTSAWATAAHAAAAPGAQLLYATTTRSSPTRGSPLARTSTSSWPRGFRCAPGLRAGRAPAPRPDPARPQDRRAQGTVQPDHGAVRGPRRAAGAALVDHRDVRRGRPSRQRQWGTWRAAA